MPATTTKTAHVAGGYGSGGTPCGVKGDPLIVEFAEDATCKSCYDKSARIDLMLADRDRELVKQRTVGLRVSLNDDHDRIHFYGSPEEGSEPSSATELAEALEAAVKIIEARVRRRAHVERYSAADREDPEHCTHAVVREGYRDDKGTFKCETCRAPVVGGRNVDMGGRGISIRHYPDREEARS